ncbi:hypothetical protein GCM10009555_103080 [Acrocarpospora macrocephala]|uniref:ABC transmembrane type-1 domain-containing protein n=1 Tax=Acrocarpospora macrocephala TaxID=150177 RepID=A0A5M3WGI7_9ACTN|nr:amino acid ABC transporter permease [Acrocarpospora macrocephala]GES07232.1 hypothetical protein Amac_008270 [Acrocarpospora macrocephala]
MRPSDPSALAEDDPVPSPTSEPARHGRMVELAGLPIRQRGGHRREIIAVAVLAVLALAVWSVVSNEALQWDIVGRYMLDIRILNGVWVTIGLTAASMAVGLVLAVIVALMRLSGNWALRQAALLFVWFFRSTPVLVLLIITFNLSLFYPTLTIGIPGGPTLISGETHTLISPFMAAVLAFALNEAAYSAEILRSSITAVSTGQWEAGTALGMTRARIYRRVVLPQALRIAIPPLGNDTINMLKGTSLVAFIAVFDLMYTAQSIYQLTYEVVPLLVVVTLWYIVLVTVLSAVQSLLERRLRGRSRKLGNAARVVAGGKPA